MNSEADLLLCEARETLTQSASLIHQFSFGLASKISENCAEIVVKKGTEMTIDMVIEYHQWLLENIRAPMYLVINKIFDYKYTTEAQVQLASLREIKAVAIVAYDRVSQTTTHIMQSVPHEKNWKIEVFSDRESAVIWLDKLATSYANKLHIAAI